MKLEGFKPMPGTDDFEKVRSQRHGETLRLLAIFGLITLGAILLRICAQALPPN